jgi:hypothetical protein
MVKITVRVGGNQPLPKIPYRLVDDLICDEQVLDRVKVEALIPLAIGLRHCSVVELPSALPDGVSLAKRIDEACRREYEELIRETNLSGRLPKILRLKDCLRAKFDDEVLGSRSYKALVSWIRKLHLRSYMVTIRPTVRELYVFKRRIEWPSIYLLSKARLRLREKALLKEGSLDEIIFPEEFSPRFIRKTGMLLGYPRCCVEAYVRDREARISVELRLSAQARSLASIKVLSLYPFYVKDFYPCSPECREAEERGLRFYNALKALNPKLGEIYYSHLERNLDFVKNYQAYLDAHRAELNS